MKEVIGDVVLYFGDCVDILPELEKVDTIITDPPYGIYSDKQGTGFLRLHLTQKEANAWDQKLPDNTIKLFVSFRNWIIWGSNYYAALLGNCVAPLVWDKGTGKSYFADGEMAFTSFDSGTLRIFRHQWCGCFKDSERGKKAQYATQKPIALMKWCIEKLSNFQLICDPCMGSGTTGVACVEMGLPFVGIEKNKKAFDLACRRIAEANKQPWKYSKRFSLLEEE